MVGCGVPDASDEDEDVLVVCCESSVDADEDDGDDQVDVEPEDVPGGRRLWSDEGVVNDG